MLLLPIQLLAQLKTSVDSHYLTEQDGTPVLLVGSAPWDINNITYDEMTRYADSCAAQEINLWHVRMMSPAEFGGPANAYGVNPWQGETQNFTATPNEAFWAHMDSVVGYAKSKGIYIVMYPDYLGNNSGQGWQNETNISGLAAMYAWGQYLGARYADSTNIIWALGGDTNPTSWLVDMDTLANGILSQGTNHLMTTRDERSTTTDTYWSEYSWVTLGGFYTNGVAENYQYAKYFRARNPKIPAGLQEAYYENEYSTPQQYLRACAYYTILGGALGFQVFGNCPIWHFDKAQDWCETEDWTSQLNSQGHINQKWYAKLFRSRYWYKLIPDTNQVVMTAGYGTFGRDTYVTTAYASDGSSIIAYLPSQGNGVTIEPRVCLGDSVRVNWFNPSNGAVTFESNEDTGNAFQITPPSIGDWVLVVDSENFDGIFDRPGGSPPQDAPLPVDLISFNASWVAGRILLEWQTATETNNYGFQIERLTVSKWEKIGFVKGDGSITKPHNYSFLDKDIVSAYSAVKYRLKQIDTDGSYEYSQVVVIVWQAPKGFSLSQNYPNPLNPETTIEYSLLSPGFVNLRLFNIHGEEVRILISSYQDVGNYCVKFNARDVPSGLYFCRLEMNGFAATKKMLVLK